MTGPVASLNHFGLTVRNIERSTAFYARFGAEVVIRESHFAGTGMDKGLGLEGVDLITRMLSFNGTLVELLEYRSPRGEDFRLRNADIGAAHLAIQVEDIHAEYESLRAEGIEFYAAPEPINEGAFEGGYWVYFRDPDGISVELIQPGPAFLAALGNLE